MLVEIGQSVRVIEGTLHPETKDDFSFWQGRVVKLLADGKVVQLELDSITLAQISDSVVKKNALSDIEPHLFFFPANTVEITEERDTIEEVYTAQDALYERFETFLPNKPSYLKQIDQWRREFGRSERFKDLEEVQQAETGFIINAVAENAYKFEQATPQQWDERVFKNIFLGTIPTKVIKDIAVFNFWIPVFTQFLSFLQEKNYLQTDALIAVLQEIEPVFEQAALDKSVWDDQKIFAMAVIEAGVDTRDQKALLEFREKFLKEQGEYKKPVVSADKIGRNDKVSVQYKDGTIKKDVKFKKVQKDVKDGKCVLI